MNRLSIVAFAACLIPAAAFALAFSGPNNLATGERPAGVAVGDFNGDGRTDIAVATDNLDKIEVFFGAGGGAFSAPTAYLTGAGTGPDALRAADVDGDLDLDLVFTLHNVNQIGTLINSGGVFALGPTGATGVNPIGLASGNLNADALPDFVAVNRDDNSITVLLNTGGGFAASNVAVGLDPRSVALGDLDGDGDSDAVVSNHDSRTVSVLFNSAGTLGSQVTYSVGGNVRPAGVALGDVDGDLDLDILAATSGNGLNFVSVLKNSGGVFGAPINFNSGGVNPDSLAVADFDQDGDRDVVVTNQDSNTIGILVNPGTGTFGAATTMPTGTTPGPIAVGDLNGDSGLDLAVSNRDSNNLSLFMNESVPVQVNPTAFSFFRGQQVSGGLSDLLISDDLKLVGRNFIVLTPGEAPLQVVFDGSAGAGTPTGLTFTLEASVSTAGLSQTIEMFNWLTGLYETVDARSASTADSTVTVSIATNPGRFVSGTGAVRAKVSYKPSGPINAGIWQARFDYVHWIIAR